jgi:hypothetical protein
MRWSYRLLHLLKVVLEILSREFKQGKKIKGIQLGRSQINPVCTWHDSTQKNPKDFNKIVFELTNMFSKVVMYKINTQESVVFPYDNNKFV